MPPESFLRACRSASPVTVVRETTVDGATRRLVVSPCGRYAYRFTKDYPSESCPFCCAGTCVQCVERCAKCLGNECDDVIVHGDPRKMS